MKQVLLIGETCIDEFIYGSVDRISQEAPCPIFLANGSHDSTEGMCGNVKNNIEQLSSNIEIRTLTNDVPIIKSRLIDTKHGNMVYRIDKHDTSPRVDLFEINRIANSHRYDAVVVSDYNKGFLSDKDLSSIGNMFSCYKFIDTKKIISTEWGKKFDFIKINADELFANIASHGSIKRVRELCNTLIVTQGEDGAIAYSEEIETFQSYKANVSHVSGAGDTFLAALVVRFLEVENVADSIDFANLCSSVAVSKENVSLVSREEADNFRRSSKNITNGNATF
jgi:bifunctional ADP-heptose synthase (sugar kinase/adenylyltransferase)